MLGCPPVWMRSLAVTSKGSGGKRRGGCEPGTRVQIFLICQVLTQNSEQSETSKFKSSLPGCYKGMLDKVNR